MLGRRNRPHEALFIVRHILKKDNKPTNIICNEKISYYHYNPVYG